MKRHFYKITIVNGGGYEIYNFKIEAANENEAIKKALYDATLNDGDTIKIEEIEDNKTYTEYDNEAMMYLTLQISKMLYFQNKWCYIDIFYEEIKKLYESYKKEDNNKVSLLTSVNDYINKHEQEIKTIFSKAFEIESESGNDEKLQDKH